jgi:hypothetical protein
MSGVMSAGRDKYIYIRDERATGVDGGDFNAGWQVRALNTIVSDEGGLAVRGGNLITLPAGVYRFRASAPCYRVDENKLQLVNITDVVYMVGKSVFAESPNLSAGVAAVSGRFAIESEKQFSLQHWATTTRLSNGFGVSVNIPGAVEVYAEIEFWREH